MTSNRNETTTTTTTINKDAIPKTTNTSHHQELFYDIFDILDEDADDIVTEDAQIREKFSMGFNFDYTHNTIEEEEEEEEEQDNDDDAIEILEEEGQDNDDDVIEILKEEEEQQILSSRSSQLLTTDDYEIEPSMNRKRRRLSITTTTDSESIRKKICTNMDDNNEIDQIPEYLLAQNKLFDRMIQKSIDTASSIDIEDLRQIAFFIHYLNFYNILYDLWSVYLKAGTGKLREEEEEVVIIEANQSINSHRRYWPKYVKSLISEQNVIEEEEEEDEQITCELMVYHHLHKYNDKIQQYQKQFIENKGHLIGFTQILEEKIELFVQQHGISYHHKKCNFAITMLKYDYEDQLLQDEYQQENPTDYQIQIAKRLYDMNVQLENMKCDYIEFRERILCNRPPTSLDTLDISLPSYINSILDENIRQQLINQHETLIQQTKIEHMAVYLAMIEAKIAQYQTIITEENDQMYENDNKHVPNKEMPRPLIRLIIKRINNMNEKLKVKCNFLINNNIRNASGHLKNIKRIGFLPNIIIDTTATRHLTNQQFRLLNRGPTYVSPCQLHISSSIQSMDDLLKQKLKPLMHKMTILLSEYNIVLPVRMNMKSNIEKEFKDFFSIPIPSNICERALYEKKLIRSIRCTLKKNNLILRRTADQNNIFYLGNMNDFHVKSNNYMQNTDNYTILFTINENNQQQVRQKIEKNFQSMNSELEKLCNEKRFNATVQKKLQVKIENLKLPYLYFLPDVSTTNSIDIKPMIIAHHSATSRIAKYLNRLLQPLIPHYMRPTIFVNEADFIQKLHYYTYKERHLHPTTLFATIKITNFHTMISHTTMVDALGNFLRANLIINALEYKSLKTTVQPQYISIDTIKLLTQLFFDNNIFYYNGNIYKFTKGSPNSFGLSETLSNIYLCLCQRIIFDDPRLKNELFGRHKNEIFLTWNRSKDELIAFLKTLGEKYRHIELDISIGRCVPFLDVQIENRHGQLYTCVYHPANIPKYTLPYVVDRAKFSHSHWFLSSLMRAVRFCSNFNDFIRERIYLQMACLTNGYSLNFIETQLKYFYKYFNAEGIRFYMNQVVYDKLRARLFDYIDRQRINLNTYQELEADERVIYFYYLYNYGSQEKFNNRFNKIWSDHLSEDPQLSNKKTKLIINPKHIYSLNAHLAQQKPSCSLLKPSKT